MNKLLLGLFLTIFTVSAFSEARTISIEGESSFKYPAEMIRVDFAVYNQSEQDVKKAKIKVERASAAIVNSLVQLGVSEEDITSPSFTVDMNNQYDRNCPNGYVPVVGRDMEVLIKDIKQYRKVIDALVDNGATKIGRVESEVANMETYENKAMLAAIEDAKKQASFIVTNLGGELGKVHSVGQKSVNHHPFLKEIAVSAMRASPGDEVPYDFKPQPVEVSARIFVEFEIR